MSCRPAQPSGPRRPRTRPTLNYPIEHTFDYHSFVINTPFTEWEGDDVHGRRPVTKPCWVSLDGLYVRPSARRVTLSPTVSI